MLIGDLVTLREVAWGDLAARQEWFRDPEVTRYLGWLDGVPVPYLQDDSPGSLEWTVALRDSQEPVGIAQLGKLDTVAAQASLGLVIGRKELWGKGLGADVIRLVLAYAFQVAALNRVWLTVESRHLKAVRLYEREGFLAEGVLRQARQTQDGLQDVTVMGILRPEWESRQGHGG